METLLVAMSVVLAVALALPMVFRKRIGHDILGWHKCDPDGFDGASMTGRCKYCGKQCMMDSQGNWF